VVTPVSAHRGLTANNRTVELIKASFVDLLWEGNQVCAMVGRNLQAGIGGFGPTLAAALRDLADTSRKMSGYPSGFHKGLSRTARMVCSKLIVRSAGTLRWYQSSRKRWLLIANRATRKSVYCRW
jgi:hypothetical protein